uniref:Uncharacterized protein n=1 Tax=Sipha flava TaxID=143950 RepID=A0A2S2R399_9HEMI
MPFCFEPRHSAYTYEHSYRHAEREVFYHRGKTLTLCQYIAIIHFCTYQITITRRVTIVKSRGRAWRFSPVGCRGFDVGLEKNVKIPVLTALEQYKFYDG